MALVFTFNKKENETNVKQTMTKFDTIYTKIFKNKHVIVKKCKNNYWEEMN